ncbi:MAG: Holliday junction branch migration protein RuvA [Candidatus Moranbacteria bacterium CG_4_9_14_3_um_filter_45_14]|nr:MAG: Holliday junction branch migration protein RuvA [Candidatus Moranbacteria bacterium CG_4_9_14_3_um_filter_45_14]
MKLKAIHMIAQLEGKIAGIKGNAVILMVGGVGYRVAVSAYTLGKVAGQEQVLFYIHTHVREDMLALYGFLNEEELAMFELLISISGIGPRVALSILSIADVKTICTAIVNKDPSILTRVSGVGKKTAERVIVELQNKVDAVNIEDQATALSGQDTILALTSLGYSVTEAREALKLVPADITDVSKRIRQALKNLGK